MCGDVGMIQRGEDFGLSSKSGEPLNITGHRCRQHFDRDLALQVDVECAIDLAHAAGAQQGENFVGAQTRTGVEWHLDDSEYSDGGDQLPHQSFPTPSPAPDWITVRSRIRVLCAQA